MKIVLAVITSAVLLASWTVTSATEEVRSGKKKSSIQSPATARQSISGTSTPKARQASKRASSRNPRRSGLRSRGPAGRRGIAGRSISVDGKSRPIGNKGMSRRRPKHLISAKRSRGKTNLQGTTPLRHKTRAVTKGAEDSPPAIDPGTAAKQSQPPTPSARKQTQRQPLNTTIATNKTVQKQKSRNPKPIQTNKVQVIRSQPLQSAPPLDEWEKYVVTVSQHYGFDDEQNGRAQSILADLQSRARQYRLSRGPEFKQAEKINDRKAKTDRLNVLNFRIDQYFNELKMRLENLPTIEQKLRAGPTPAASPKSSRRRTR